jgi:hypothetical protein
VMLNVEGRSHFRFWGSFLPGEIVASVREWALQRGEAFLLRNMFKTKRF